jgi:fructosamine-3-kinase
MASSAKSATRTKTVLLQSITVALRSFGFEPANTPRIIGEGFTFLTVETHLRGIGDVAVKVAKAPVTEFGSDPQVSVRCLLEQEAHLSQWARNIGLMTPRCYGVYSSAEVVFGVFKALHSVGKPNAKQIGHIAATIHRATPPLAYTAIQLGLSFKSYLFETLARRGEFVDSLFGGGNPKFWRAICCIEKMPWPERPARVLHMDLRPDNIICTPRGAHVVDWSAGLVGDPVMELVRLEELGLADKGFYEEYRRAIGDECECPPAVLKAIYQIHTLTMLVIFFGVYERTASVRGILQRLQLSRNYLAGSNESTPRVSGRHRASPAASAH